MRLESPHKTGSSQEVLAIRFCVNQSPLQPNGSSDCWEFTRSQEGSRGAFPHRSCFKRNWAFLLTSVGRSLRPLSCTCSRSYPLKILKGTNHWQLFPCLDGSLPLNKVVIISSLYPSPLCFGSSPHRNSTASLNADRVKEEVTNQAGHLFVFFKASGNSSWKSQTKINSTPHLKQKHSLVL